MSVGNVCASSKMDHLVPIIREGMGAMFLEKSYVWCMQLLIRRVGILINVKSQQYPGDTLLLFILHMQWQREK
jgi:hypothetical protein